MLLFRYLKSKTRTFSTFPLFPWYAPLNHHYHHHHHNNNPLFRLPSPSPFPRGPLFLIFPPWKLSQSATPLYFVANTVVFPNLNLPNPLPLPLPLLDRVKPHSDFDHSSPQHPLSLFDSFVNVPNFISFTRMASGPLLGWMILNEMYTPAMIGLSISGATDWLDGYVARKMNIDSVVGSYLDPLADKVLMACVAVAMLHNHLLHPGLVGLVVFRDVFLVGGAVYLRASSLGWKWKSWHDFFNLDGNGRQKVEPLFISKVNTVFQLVLVAAALLQPEFGTPETEIYVTYLSYIVASTTMVSTAAYGAQYHRRFAIASN
ncbi:hypothetical protein Lal_00049593 [Lupinus albus]|uniref:Putative CDP-alcohol phosphatidyltransferase n=1 Tax=Lupinus albus TaxID=3870 RepID=A0A6A4PKL1_LUPAL|nr:putative CDP-alcohol phosphatidyltransferase [Lupinus albus]KAF1867164.1 hypothetical protein Lal_00049593 [Lupinus albus]